MPIIKGTSIGGMELQIEYSYTQNKTANTSTVTATLKLVNHYALYASALSGSYLSVGGSKTEYSKYISYDSTSATTTTTLATKKVTINHNSDGTATCALAGTFVMNGTYRGYSVGTMTASQTITLDTIPRSSSLSVPTSVDTDSVLSGSITPSSSAFNHKVEFKVGSELKSTIPLAENQSNPTFEQKVDHNWFPSSTSGVITVVLSTYNDNTLIATTSKNVTANVPSSIVPFISSLDIESSDDNGAYVQGKTVATITTEATSGIGSYIVSYSYNGLGLNTTTNANTITTPVLQSPGSQSCVVTVTDARGRTASATTSVNVLSYAAPTIGPVSVQRCDKNGNITDNGTYAKYTVNSSYSSVDGRNTRTITVAYSSNDGASYSQETTLQAANTITGIYGDGVFASTKSYKLLFTIKDSYGASAYVEETLKSASRSINMLTNGKGVAFGKMAEKDNLLDVAWEIQTDEPEKTLTNLSYHGTNVYNNSSDDTSSKWGKLGNLATTFYTDSSGGIGKPSIWGLLLNVAAGVDTSEVHQLWFEQSDGSVFHRGGNGNGLNAWKRIIDNTNIGEYVITPADYVVEQGSSNDWSYTKWNSGKAEACCKIDIGEVALTSNLATGVYSNTSYNGKSVTLPSGLFVATPMAFGNVYSNGYTHCQVSNATTSLVVYRLWSPYSANITGTVVSLYVVGRWK